MKFYEVQNLEVDAEITTFRITRKTTLIEDCFIVSDTQERAVEEANENTDIEWETHTMTTTITQVKEDNNG